MQSPTTAEDLKEVGLVYVHDTIPGISRERRGKGFAYRWPDGRLIDNEALLARIRKLAIPPAYTNVWICPIENGHLQATGRDARGRKQYRYHPKWIELTSGNKFSRMIAFGEALQYIRARIDHDLSKPGMPREKVLATVVWFLEKSLIRVGNEEYAKDNNSYGLTTLQMRHIKIDGSIIQFRFVGKRGIKHNVEVADRRMAGVVKKMQELPGQELFQYVDENGKTHSVTSADVNAYLREISGEDFTAKDFRTWAATVMALVDLSHCCGFASKRDCKRAITKAMTDVARQLGNTPAICRKSYVHPGIVSSFESGSLRSFLGRRSLEPLPEGKVLDRTAEVVALEFLRQLEKSASQAKAA